MKIFISIDLEGINGICNWDETEIEDRRYYEFQNQLIKEVSAACIGVNNAWREKGKKDELVVYVKDAHSSARNLFIEKLPEYVVLHRGWEGGLCSMMGGLDSSFDAVCFVGYHSPSRNPGNPLSHTMNTKITHVKINGEIASEFTINSLYASSLGVPVAFLSGDEALTELVKKANGNITTVATKKGIGGAVVSKHPAVTVKEIEEKIFDSLMGDLSKNIVKLPEKFDIEIQYKRHQDAYANSFFPGCRLINSDTVAFSADNYRDALVALKFIL